MHYIVPILTGKITISKQNSNKGHLKSKLHMIMALYTTNIFSGVSNCFCFMFTNYGIDHELPRDDSVDDLMD